MYSAISTRRRALEPAEALDDRVVPAVAFAAHAADEVVLLEDVSTSTSKVAFMFRFTVDVKVNVLI
jgi:hypothetical protein